VTDSDAQATRQTDVGRLVGDAGIHESRAGAGRSVGAGYAQRCVCAGCDPV
jgi:hypothetical protein